MMLLNDRDLATALGDYWDERTADLDIGADPFGLSEGMDSLTAIDVLLDLESKFDLAELPVSLIKCGGYQGRDEFVTLVSENLRRHLVGEVAVCCA